MNNASLTSEEIEGVKMIQALLKFNGQSEPEEVSLANWREMSEGARHQTKWAYDIFIKE